MKWFKHATDSSSLKEYISIIQTKFGLPGYSRIFKLMEAIASQMEVKESPATVEYPLNKWCQILCCKEKVLVRFFNFLENNSIISTEETENGLRVTFDRLRESLDNRAASSDLRGPSRDPNQNRAEHITEKTTDRDKNDDGTLIKKLTVILRGKDLKEKLPRFLLEEHSSGTVTKANLKSVIDTIESYFARMNSDKAQRYGNLLVSITKFVICALDETAGKSPALYPSVETILKVVELGTKPLEDDREYIPRKTRLRGDSFNADDLFYVKHRFKNVKKENAEWIPRKEKQLIDLYEKRKRLRH